jgi:hypothetical protein
VIATIFFIHQATTSGEPVWTVEAAIAAAVAAIAAVDLLVINHRIRQNRPK